MDYVNNINALSAEGAAALRENDVSKEMLLCFNDDDIKDLFKSFNDRYNVRRYIKNLTESENIPKVDSAMTAQVDSAMEANTSSASLEESENDDGDVIQTSQTYCIDKANCSFTAEEMLQKKDKRGKPTPAQLFFHNIIRDCASAAKIWKRAPMLTEISSTKKQNFLCSVIEAAPQLKYKQKDIWQRLGTALQNRRKYITDKNTGKRQPRKKSDHFEVGDHVDLLTRERKQTVGEGIVVKIEEVYSEVVLKDFRRAALTLCDDQDIELPEPVDGKVKLESNLIKRIIKWRTIRLRKHIRKKASTSTSEVGESTGGREDSSREKASPHQKSKTSTSKPDDKAILSPPQKSKTSSNQNDKAIFTPPQKSKTSSKQNDMAILTPRQDSTQETSTSKQDEKVEVAVFEWDKGQLYLGMFQEKDKKTSIINCEKPVGKIQLKPQPHLVIYLTDKSTGILKLNRSDIQPNPDKAYLVAYARLRLDKEADRFIIKDQNKFIGQLQTFFEEYAAEKDYKSN